MKRKISVRVATILFIALIASATGITWAVYKKIIDVPTSGNMEGFKLETSPSSVEWGNVTYDKPILKSISVKNTCSVPISNLHMTYALPEGFTGSLTWDIEGIALGSDESTNAILNLTITEAPEGPFNFNFTIYGE